MTKRMAAAKAVYDGRPTPGQRDVQNKGTDSSGVSQLTSKLGNEQSKVPSEVWLDKRIAKRRRFDEGAVRQPPLIGTVIHATKGPKVKSGRFPGREKGTAWHFTIARDGTAYQHQPVNWTAGHAGKKRVKLERPEGGWGSGRMANRRTLGIELANGLCFIEHPKGGFQKFRQKKEDKKDIQWDPMKGEGKGKQVKWISAKRLEKHGKAQLPGGAVVDLYWERYPPKQIAKLKEVLIAVADKGHVDALLALRHQDILSSRKVDPGPAFPWISFNMWALQEHANRVSGEPG